MAATAVMKPYGVRKPMALGWRILLGLLLLFVAAFYGLLSAILPMQLLMYAAAPILAIAALCLWLLPDRGGVYESYYAKLLTMVVAFHILFPPYIALNFPGLPWISPMRVLVGMLAAAFLFNLASSSQMRNMAFNAVSAVPEINKLFWAFWALTVVTIPLSVDIPASMTKFFNNQIFWTMMFVLAAFVGRQQGVISRTMTVMFVAVLPTAIMTIFEYRAQSVVWVPYVPNWLWGDEELIIELLSSSARAGTDVYRARGTTAVSLYYAQYLAIAFPAGLYILSKTDGLWRKSAVIAALMLYAVAMFLTGARTAMAGLLVALVSFIFLIALRNRTQNPNSLGATATIIAYPALLAVVTVLVLTWRRAYVMILGGGQHQASSDARETQWRIGLEILKRNPFGHGASRSGEVLGYTNAAGDLTIDTYFLSVMLDYGVVALPIFVTMFVLPIYFALEGNRRRYQDPELGWLIPIGIGLMNLAIIASVLSSESNFSVVFIMLGFSVALVARMRAELGTNVVVRPFEAGSALKPRASGV